jgi:hypothetical protein
MSNLKNIGNKLFKEATELKSHDVKLNMMDDIVKADNQARASQRNLSKIIQNLETDAKNSKKKHDLVVRLSEKALSIAKELGDNKSIKNLNSWKAEAEAESNKMDSVISKVKSINL